MVPTGDVTVTLRAGIEYNYAPVFVPVVCDAHGGGDDLPPYTISAKQQSLAVGENIAASLGANDYKEPQVVCCPCVFEAYQHHGYRENEVVGTLTAEQNNHTRGDTPLVVCTWDARGNGDGATVNTITGDHNNRVTDYTSVVVEKAYCIGNGQANQSYSEKVAGALNCMHDQQAVVYGVDCRNLTETPELYQTLQAKSGGGWSLNYSGAVRIRYTVRRLTPTECARLQGFADRWGHPDRKDDFTDEEYRFWMEVRNTHAAINGKAVKDYTKEQMLKWYNKLHTDSAEYKMWGNGIALPPGLYVMQGIVDALESVAV